MLKLAGCYFIEDIILKYLEIFTMNSKELYNALTYLKEKYGNNYMNHIGNNMTILNEIVNK